MSELQPLIDKLDYIQFQFTTIFGDLKAVEFPAKLWPEMSDGTGVDGYRIFRDGVEIATTTGTTITDSGLAPATSYEYRVSAYDFASPPNESASSSPATVTTPPVEDPPGQVQNLRRTDRL